MEHVRNRRTKREREKRERERAIKDSKEASLVPTVAILLTLHSA